MHTNYQEGTILNGDRKNHPDAYHPIVFLRDNEGSPYFVGLMLTKYASKKNLKMKPEHFTNGFIYKNTHVANAFLLKREEWRPFTIIGNLTKEGLDYIHRNISTNEPKLWEDYNISRK